MQVFNRVYYLAEGRLAELTPPSGDRPSGKQAADAPPNRDILIVCGEYFYRHSRAQDENEHLTVKAVLENALLIEVKTTIDQAIGHLGGLGIDIVAVVLGPHTEGYEYSYQRFF